MIDLGAVPQYGRIEVALNEARVRRLQERSGNALGVAMGAGAGRWTLSAAEFVGSLVVDDMRVLIRPKIPPENLFLLLEVGLPPDAWRREAFEYSVTGDLLPAVVSFLARTIETTLARGLLHSYQRVGEELVALRGRVDVAASFRQPGRVAPVPCDFEEFTEDVFENRYLRAAVRRCLLVPRVLPEDRRRLLKLIAEMERVSEVHVHPKNLDQLVVTRLNEHYLPALRLARIVLENLTMIDQRGTTSASSFLVDMNKLFERFVSERLRRALLGRLEVRTEPRVDLDLESRVRMYPDLQFRRRGHTVFVGDLKYKLVGDARARNADYYQLLAYTTALNLPEGVLIYCLADGGVQQGLATVRHAGKRLHLWALDLSGSAAEIQRQIETLADWIAELSLLGSARLSRTPGLDPGR